MNELKIVSMAIYGQIPLKKQLSTKEGNELVQNFGYAWINEEMSPRLSKNVIIRPDGEKQPFAMIVKSGKVSILGVRSIEEAEKVFKIIRKEIKEVISGTHK